MLLLRCLLGGTAGGLIGLAIWAAVAHFTGFEVGYIAWGVGFLTGFGVRAMSQDHSGAVFGVLAVLLAAASIAGAKYLVVCIQLSDLGEIAIEAEPDSSDALIANVAVEVGQEFEQEGRNVDWPPPDELDDEAQIEALRQKSEVWQEAARRWNELPPDEKQTRIKQHNEEMAKLMGELKGLFRDAAFQASFTAYDLLWFGLAALTAFRLGSGNFEESE